MVPCVLTKQVNTNTNVNFVYERRYGHFFFVEVTGEMTKKLQGCYYFLTAQHYAQLRFSRIVNFIIMRLCEKISCAHACADIFYSLYANEKLLKMPKIS